jgi:phage terminase large subunit-like protein
VELIDGEVMDYSRVEERIGELAQVFTISEVVFDPKFAEELTQRIVEAGVPERVAFAQNWANFGPPTDEFERRVIAGKVHHNGQPVLTWQVQHTKVRHSFTGLKWPCKPGDRSDHRTIDGSVASIMGLARLMTRPKVEEFAGCGIHVLTAPGPDERQPWEDDDDDDY